MARSRVAAVVGGVHGRRQRRHLVSTAAGAVLERHGREEDRHRRRRGHRQRDAIARQVRADRVEEEAGERKATSRGQVGRVDQDLGSASLLQIGERRALEQMLVVVLRRELAAVEVERAEAHPVARAEELEGEASLHGAPEEVRLEVAKDAVTVEPVVGRGEAPPGHGGDEVDLVEQPTRPATQDHGGGRELLQHAVGERRRPGAAPGERQDQQQLIRPGSRGGGQARPPAAPSAPRARFPVRPPCTRPRSAPRVPEPTARGAKRFRVRQLGTALSARERTITVVKSEIMLSSIISTLARRVSGTTSAGLNAVAVL